MDWNVAFYVRNLPRKYHFEDKHFMMAEVTDDRVELLLKHTLDMPEVQSFFSKPRNGKIGVIIFRVEADDESDALTFAAHQLGGFIDGLAMLVDREVPEVCALSEVRKVPEPDANLVRLGNPGWAYFQPKDAATAAIWQDRQDRVHHGLMPFFDVAAGIHPQSGTSLGRQLLYSMKMYRAGAATEDFGLEFICKWSALEGLVCGGETHGKGELIRTRLPSLQPSPVKDVESAVKELWKYRNMAVHEALAFKSDHLNEAPPLAIWIEPVERLFLAVVTFALAHLDKADSVKTLWPYAANFLLPAYVAEMRPNDMGRWPITKIKFDTERVVVGGGLHFDRAFAWRDAKKGVCS